MTISKTHNYECCMCGDHGLSHELFRCKVCHFRSQHRYCSNLYPKAESYRVCNWCLIQKDDHHNNHTTTTTTTTPSNNNSSSPTMTSAKKLNNNHPTGGPKAGGASPKCLQPTSPIKKPIRSPEARSSSGRKRITAQAQAQQDEKLIMRRTKSSEEISNNKNNNSSSNSPRSGGSGGPAVIKHVFRNKVRRYKLLDEVSS